VKDFSISPIFLSPQSFPSPPHQTPKQSLSDIELDKISDIGLPQ